MLLISLMFFCSIIHTSENALVQASADGDIEKVQRLLQDGADVDAIDETGDNKMTALMAASFSKDSNRKVAELLLKHEANVNAANKEGMTPLMCASICGCEEKAELLLRYGADANARSMIGQTPLMLAFRYNRKELADLLVRKGAKVPETASEIVLAEENDDDETDDFTAWIRESVRKRFHDWGPMLRDLEWKRDVKALLASLSQSPINTI